MAIEFPKNFKYSEKKSEKEANEMRDIAGKNANKNEYDIAQELIDDDKEKKREVLFNELLKDKLNQFEPGNFLSNISGIKKINIVSGPKDIDGKTKCLHIKLIGEYAGKIKTVGFTMNNNGELLMEYKKSKKYFEELGVSEEEIYDEILNIAEKEKIGLFVRFNREILPGEPPFTIVDSPTDKHTDPGQPGGPEEIDEEREIDPFDPMRIELMSGHDSLLFGVSGRNGFISGYHGFIFPKAVIYDHVNVGNPILIYEFDNKIDTNKYEMNLLPQHRITNTERDNIIKQHNIDYISTLSRKEFQELGGFRKYNPQRFRVERVEGESETEYEERWRERWERKMKEIIETYGV